MVAGSAAAVASAPDRNPAQANQFRLRADTIVARLLNQATSRPHAAAYYHKENGLWQMTDWVTYAQSVRRAGKSLMALGVTPGDRVAILGFNRPEWALFHLGAMSVGGISAGVYTSASAQQTRHILRHAGASIVLIDDQSQWQAIDESDSGVRHIVSMTRAAQDRAQSEQTKSSRTNAMIDWAEFMTRGDTIPDHAFDERVSNLEPAAPAALIYTPGTEGQSKGIILSHHNLAWTAKAMNDLLGGGPDDTTLTYLPLAHVLEQVVALYLPITAGCSVYFAESLDAVAENMREVQPTLVFTIPRIWQRFHAGISGNLGKIGGLNGSIAAWARRVARTVNQRRNQGQKPGLITRLQFQLARYLLLAKLKSVLGLKNARFCASSAAPIADEVLDFFASLDIVIHEIYGLTETCGVVSSNRPGQTRFGSAGQPIPGCEVTIAGDSEILVRGPHVFLGYDEDESATQTALSDGWLRTGDLGEVDSRGNLTVIGRKQEIITAGSARIAPRPIEAALESSWLIQDAMLVGHGRDYISALISVDADAAAHLVAAPGLDHPLDPGSTDPSPELLAAVQEIIDQVNSQLAEDEAIKKFTILGRPLAIEHGELTPTLTIRRSVIHENYATEIAAMYPATP